MEEGVLSPIQVVLISKVFKVRDGVLNASYNAKVPIKVLLLTIKNVGIIPLTNIYPQVKGVNVGRGIVSGL